MQSESKTKQGVGLLYILSGRMSAPSVHQMRKATKGNSTTAKTLRMTKDFKRVVVLYLLDIYRVSYNHIH